MDRKNDFLKILKKNSELMFILDEVSVLNLPNYYLAAGSVFQTVWNYSDGNNLMTGIHDIDIVYFDKEISADSSAKNDKKLEKVLSEKFPINLIFIMKHTCIFGIMEIKYRIKTQKMRLSVGLLRFML
ncbi:hypothetical protein JRY11_002129 [Lactococcus lactis]|nr:hypothetical protein JRY11_002129 [Lactococcus lactis]